MSTVDVILKEIKSLNYGDKLIIYRKIKEDLLVNHEKILTKNIEKYRGIAKNIWNRDAQEYINYLRENDRI